MKREIKVLDVRGVATGIPLTAKNFFLILIAIAIPPLINRISFFDGHCNAGLALGFTISVMLLLLTGLISLGAGSILLTFLGLASGLLNTNEILAGSLFYQFIGFCVIGYGAEATPFGKRFSYWLLRSWGQRPNRIVIAFLFVSAILSSFLSNTAIMIMMASICHQVMKQMGQEAGKSKFATTCMLACTIGPCIGGVGFIQGFGGTNLYAIEQMASVTNGKFHISALQWAIGGWSTLIFTLPIVAFLILKILRFDASSITVPGKEYYDDRLRELGPISGNEFRWITYAISMIVLLMVGIESTMLLLALIVLCIMPGVGCFTAQDAFTKAVPWEVVFGGVGMCVMGTMFSKSGLTNMISDLIAPRLKAIPPFSIMLILSLIIAILSMYFIATTYPCIAIGVTMTAPIIEAIGLNPAIILFPVMLSLQYMFGIFAIPIIQQNYRYGYWKKSQITGIGTIVMLVCVLCNCAVSYFLLPSLWHIPLYL